MTETSPTPAGEHLRRLVEASHHAFQKANGEWDDFNGCSNRYVYDCGWDAAVAHFLATLEAHTAETADLRARLAAAEAALRKIDAGDFNCAPRQFFMAAQGIARAALQEPK